jgi:hypothetical protein
MKKPSPTKADLARLKVLVDLGHSPSAAGKQIGVSHHTALRYLRSEVYHDPDIQQLVDRIKHNEITDLRLLEAKARARLHELLNEGKSKIIETTAVMDRAFQQRRLLEGEATQILGIQHLPRLVKEIEAIEQKLLAEGVAREDLDRLKQTVEEDVARHHAGSESG